MVRWLVVLVVCCGVLTPTAGAATTVNGVTVQRVRSGLSRLTSYTATLSESAQRVVAGRWVRFGCLDLNAGELWAETGDGIVQTQLVARRNTVLRLRGFAVIGPDAPVFHADACYLRISNGRLFEVPLTALGRRHVDERHAFQALLGTGSLATRESGEPATVQEAVSEGLGFVEALPGPDAAPAAGHGGYWREGDRSVLATVTSDGRRMFVERGPPGVLRTNVFGFLTAEDAGCGEDPAVTRRAGGLSCAGSTGLGFA